MVDVNTSESDAGEIEVTATVTFEDGFREGFLQGFMAGYFADTDSEETGRRRNPARKGKWRDETS